MKSKKNILALICICAAILVVLWQPWKQNETEPPQEKTVSSSSSGSESAGGAEAGMELLNDSETMGLLAELTDILGGMSGGAAAKVDSIRIREIEKILYPNLPEGFLSQWLQEQTPEGKKAKDAKQAEFYISAIRSSARSIQSLERSDIKHARTYVEKAEQSGSEELMEAAQNLLQAAQKALAAEKKHLDAIADQLAALEVSGHWERLDAMEAARKNEYRIFKEKSAARSELLTASREHGAVENVADARGYLEASSALLASAESDRQRAAAERAVSAAEEWVSFTAGLLENVRSERKIANTSDEADQAFRRIAELNIAAVKAWGDARVLFNRQKARSPGGSAPDPSASSQGSDGGGGLSDFAPQAAREFASKTGREAPTLPSGAAPDASIQLLLMAREYEREGYEDEARGVYERVRNAMSAEELERALRFLEENAEPQDR